MRNVTDKTYREDQNTNFVFINFFPPENHGFYAIMRENMLDPDRQQMAI